MYRQAQALLDELHIDVNPRMEVRRLSIAHKQMVEIAGRSLPMPKFLSWMSRHPRCQQHRHI